MAATRQTALHLCSLGLVLLCATDVQGDVEPTSALISPVLSETAPTWQSSLPEDILEGSGMSPSTPNFYSSDGDLSFHVHPSPVNVAYLPASSISPSSETPSSTYRNTQYSGFSHFQEMGSSEIPYYTQTPWSSDEGDLRSVQPSAVISYRTLSLSTVSSSFISGKGETSIENNVTLSFMPSRSSTIPLRSSDIINPLTATSRVVVNTSHASLNSGIVESISPSVRENVLSTDLTITRSLDTTAQTPANTSVSRMAHRTTERSGVSINTLATNGPSISTPVLQTTYPPDRDPNESHYTLFLRTKKCPFMFANELQKELAEHTFSSANYSTSRWNVLVESCSSHVNVSIRTNGPSSLDDLISQFNNYGSKNISIRFFNRTFYIVHIQKHEDVRINVTTFSPNSTITIITKNEFSAYVAVGVTFGLVLIVCITVCCAKFCAKRPRKPLGTSRSSQMHLRFEDYTLTPIPRPSSLYVDYYRGSVMGDHYSTTSAGSITSTPTVEQGVVQPFDTCIVPLEDSEAILEDPIKKPLPETAAMSHIPNLNIHPNANPILAHCINTKSESNERLHPKYQKAVELKNSGLANPTFQRY